MDVVVWLASHDALPESCSDLAQFGVLTVQLGDEEKAPPYWTESLEERLVSKAAIHWHAAVCNRARIVRISETSTPGGWFFTRNAAEPLTAVNRMIAGVALDIAAEGEGWRQRASNQPELDRRPPHRAYASNVDSLVFIGKQTARSVRLRVQARGRRFVWFTAIRRRSTLFYANNGRFLSDEWQEVPVPLGSEMADPFVFERNGKAWLFYEDVPAGSLKGRLSCMEIGSEDNRFGQPQVILDLPYHLSYPCLIEDRGEVFLLPETSAAGTVELYRATQFPLEFKPATILMDGVPLVDTTPFFLDGIWYFFTTTTQPFMETFLFWSDALDGRWRMHPRSPISSSVFSCRSAGHLFYSKGRLLRPTQDCSVRYGYGMTINEITRLTPTEFEEHRIDFIGPDWQPDLLGTHTLNASSNFEVVDGVRYAQ
jgi:hypothetical protein